MKIFLWIIALTAGALIVFNIISVDFSDLGNEDNYIAYIGAVSSLMVILLILIYSFNKRLQNRHKEIRKSITDLENKNNSENTEI